MKTLEMKKEYGRLTVLKEVERRKGSRNFLCKCICGSEKIVAAGNLKQGHVKSCGCLKRDAVYNQTHGLSRDSNRKKTRLFRIWTGMKTRCFNPNDKAYKNYGGRGITVCPEWMDFKRFHDWSIAHGYQNGLTIERIRINENYDRDNCEWISLGKQARNRTNTLVVTYQGQTRPLTEWCERLGLNYQTVFARLKYRKWNVEKALETPIQTKYREAV